MRLTVQEQDEKVMCISVIDENNNATTDEQWSNFRADHPNRDFCLLKPVPSKDGALYVPNDFKRPEYSDKLIYSQVRRSGKDASRADDWYEICNLEESKAKGLRRVILFIDNSGSMDTSTVKASLNLFAKTTRRNGFEIIEARRRKDENYVAACWGTRVY